MKEAEIVRFLKIYLLIFTVVFCGSNDDNECADSSQEMIPVGGNLSFEIHVRDVNHFGLKIYNGDIMFVDLNVPGTSLFLNQANEKRTRISLDKTRYVVQIQISELKRLDGGKYVIKGRHLQNDTYCRVVYVLDYPLVRVESKAVGRRWFEAGSDMVLTCTAESTTYPGGPNLVMHITWLVNGTEHEERVRVFVVEKVTHADNGTIIACQAKEGDDGKSSKTDFIVIVHWGPKDIKFYPPKELYKVSPGTILPNINGTADCFPPCSYKWTKDGKKLSDNGILSLGTVTQTSEGVYILTASRKESSGSQMKSLTVVLKVAVESNNYYGLLILPVFAGICVLVVIWKWKIIKGVFKCCKTTTETNDLNQTSTELIGSASSCTPSKDNVQNEIVENKTLELETYVGYTENKSDTKDDVRRNLLQSMDACVTVNSGDEN